MKINQERKIKTNILSDFVCCPQTASKMALRLPNSELKDLKNLTTF